jgi:CDGSH-type Zn-finger protein
MAQPVASQNRPYVIEVEEGKKVAWCACGRSANQPFCDGSHSRENTGVTPIVFTVEKSGKAALCGCRTSGNKPHCDGSHKNLD